MDDQLTQAQLTQIVAEVERLSQSRQQELDPEQVKEILQELSLPPELMDEAMLQLRRREALAVQQRRNRSIAAGVVAALVIGIGATGSIQMVKSSIKTATKLSRLTSRSQNTYCRYKIGTATQTAAATGKQTK